MRFLLNLVWFCSVVAADSMYNISFHDNIIDWLDITSVELHQPLSTTYFSSVSLSLPFSFPFYNITYSSVTITSQGFLYLSSYHISPHVANVSYIAPLMAGFKPGDLPQEIRYITKQHLLVVEWRNMTLDEKRYTFQLQLYTNGTALLLYKDLPIPVTEMPDEVMPVEVGVRAYSVTGFGSFKQKFSSSFQQSFKRFVIASPLTIKLSPSLDVCCEASRPYKVQWWCSQVLPNPRRCYRGTEEDSKLLLWLSLAINFLSVLAIVLILFGTCMLVFKLRTKNSLRIEASSDIEVFI